MDAYDEWLEQQRLDHEQIAPHPEPDDDPFIWQHEHIYRDEPHDPWADFDGVAAADSVIDRWFDRFRA